MKLEGHQANFYTSTFSADLYRKQEYIYKIIKKTFIGSNHVLKQIKYNYVISKETSESLVLPNKLLADNIYRMNFIEGYNIDTCFKNKSISLEKRIAIVNTLFRNLQEVHQFLIVGDVAARNCMIPKDIHDKNIYLIDFDFAAPINASYEALSPYDIVSESGIIIPSNCDSDIVKLFIVSLNLLYQWDFEKKFIRHPKLKLIREFLRKNVQNNGYLLEYFNYISDGIENNQPSEYLHLPDSRAFRNEIEKGMKRIRNLKNI